VVAAHVLLVAGWTISRAPPLPWPNVGSLMSRLGRMDVLALLDLADAALVDGAPTASRTCP
jgi:hypothetical protein